MTRRPVQIWRSTGRSTAVEGLSGTDVPDFLLEGCSRICSPDQPASCNSSTLP